MRALLICDHLPGQAFGTAQRVTLLHEALSRLGECRILHLSAGNTTTGAVQPDYSAPIPFPEGSGSLKRVVRRLTFGEFREDRQYRPVIERIRTEYPFDLALCSFFRNNVAAPIGLAACFLDADAIDPMTGPIGRLLRPVALTVMRRRARAFDGVYVIRDADRQLLGPELAGKVELLPGLSLAAGLRSPPSGQPREVVFVGPMWWPPNRAAADWLVASGVPAILAARNLRLRLIGSGTEMYGDGPGLSGAGFVEDIAVEYARAALVLCPVPITSGANIKLAEAIQSGCAVLASPEAAAAFIGVLDPDRDLVHSPPSDFIATMVALLDDPARLVQLKMRARVVAADVLNPERVIKNLAISLSGRVSAAAVG